MERRRSRLGWAGALHAGLLLAFVGGVTGALNCSGDSAPYVVSQPNPAARAADQCSNTCAGCANMCSCGGDEKKNPMSSLRAGDEVAGEIALEASLNGRLRATVELRGTLRVLEAPAEGPLVARGRLEALEFAVGERRYSGAGEVDLRLERDLRLTLSGATLPEEVVAALEAAEPFAGGAFRVESSVAPDEDLRRALSKELDVASGRAEGTGTCLFRSERRRFHATARYGVDAQGRRSVRWEFGR